MIRESLSTSAAHAMMAVTPGNGTAFQRRPVTGGSSLHKAGPAAAAPYWVRHVRQGDLFSAYVSGDGAHWTLVGTESIAMTTDVYIGLAVTSHEDGTVAAAVFRDVSVSGTGVGTSLPGTTDPGTTDPGTTDPGTDTLGSFSLRWTAPVTRADGTPLSLADIDGYRIHYGTSAGNYPDTLDIKDGSAQSAIVNDLPAGTYRVVMTTYDTSGQESAYSAEIEKIAR
jgi:hypothetical protein